jgi:hypothetical protein
MGSHGILLTFVLHVLALLDGRRLRVHGVGLGSERYGGFGTQAFRGTGIGRSSALCLGVIGAAVLPARYSGFSGVLAEILGWECFGISVFWAEMPRFAYNRSGWDQAAAAKRPTPV